MKEKIEAAVREALAQLGAPDEAFVVEYPPAETGADYACNAALVAGKKLGQNPRDVAVAMRAALEEAHIPGVEKIEIAGPGFLNIFLSSESRAAAIAVAREKGDRWGSNDAWSDKTIMVEYTDPNPFKEFHIGHLMSNAIGESVARLLERSGAAVIRANYQGDVGPHVAKAIWGLLQEDLTQPTVAQISAAYVRGATAYEESADAKREIEEINKKVYEKSDEKINALYVWGREETLKHFEDIYALLGTTFDEYFFESETGPRGLEVVRAHPELFVESAGAIVFHGEEHDPKLHTRVFINKQGLPTYEAKEIGLAEMKRERRTFDRSITVTALEQEAYFNVVFVALGLVHPEWKDIFEHIHHGMMQLSSGKMSSRKGNVITGESLVDEMIMAAKEKMGERGVANPEEVARQIAVAAIKFSVLKQGAGKNIIFDPEKSLSLEGESGPYIQYAHTRCVSVLKKAEEEGVALSAHVRGGIAADIERLLPRFPEVVERAAQNYEPHFVAQYLIELSSAFNSWYAQERILGTPDAADKLALVNAVRQTLKNGLWLLGISAPEEM